MSEWRLVNGGALYNTFAREIKYKYLQQRICRRFHSWELCPHDIIEKTTIRTLRNLYFFLVGKIF